MARKSFKTGIVLNKKTKDKIFICGMLFLPICSFLVFYVYTNLNSILIAFQIPSSSDSYTWGIDHFLTMFKEFSLSGSVLSSALKNTMLFFFSGILITFPLSFVLCYFIYKKIAGYRFFRVVFYLPNIISASVIAILFKYMIAGNGPISVLYAWTGKEIPNFLSNSSYAMGTLIFYNIFFGLGGNIILFSGAMSNIDNGIIEAAKIDGVGMMTEMIKIIIPLMWPTMSTVLLFQFIGIFNASGPILLLTKGAYDTFTLSYWIYDRVAFSSDLNYPAAVGLFFTIIGAPLAMFFRWVLTRGLEDVA